MSRKPSKDSTPFARAMIIKKVLIHSLAIIVFLVPTLIIPAFYPTGMAIYLRLFLLFLILVEGLILFKIVFMNEKRSEILKKLGTIVFSLFVAFIFMEAIFMFIPRSHNYDYTLASKLWEAKYWKPINSLGFRDKEPGNKNSVILFVGDSFTAGDGLESVNDRFSNIVGAEMNKKEKKYTIINIGRKGLQTKEEFVAMKNFLYATIIKPQIIVLQYYGNDIANVAQENGLIFKGSFLYANVNKVLIPVISNSYFINYLYWLHSQDYITEPYITFLAKCYSNHNVLSKHKEEIMLFVNYAKENSIKLIVVVFPLLQDIERSDSMYVNDIVDFLKGNKICTINVSNLVKELPIEDRIINKNNGHASNKVNRIVAQEIFRNIAIIDTWK